MIKPKNLLIVRTDRIGDVVLSLPLARIVKKHYPECRITFMLREYTRDLADGNPYIDEILLLETSGKKVLFRKNIKKLIRKHFDTVIIVYPTYFISLIIFLSRIKNRIGTGYRWYSFLFNFKTYEHRKNAVKHELEYNLSLLEHFSIMSISEEERTDFSLKVKKPALEKVASLLKENGISPDDNIIIVHPGSGGSAVDLPLQKFRDYIKLVSEKISVKILITGSNDEIEKCNTLVINEKVKNLAGYFNLAELIALISLSSLFVSNSTGPLHIAAALDRYTIGFYPKVRQCSAKRWGPYSKKGFVFEPEIKCNNCTVEQCLNIECMNSIDIQKVFEKTEKILKLLSNTGEIDVK